MSLKKNSDTLFIYGTGDSLNEISDSEYEAIKKFDSISINLFPHTKIHLSHYILGEGLYYLQHLINTQKDDKMQEEYDSIINTLKTVYKNTNIIMIKKYDTMAFLNKYYLKVKEDLIDLKDNIYEVDCDHSTKTVDFPDNHILKKLYHNGGSICCAINYAIQMNYKKVVFAGVDLYNCIFKTPSHLTKKIYENNPDFPDPTKDRHPSYNSIFGYLNYIKNSSKKIDFYTYNPKSLLKNIIPVYKLE